VRARAARTQPHLLATSWPVVSAAPPCVAAPCTRARRRLTRLPVCAASPAAASLAGITQGLSSAVAMTELHAKDAASHMADFTMAWQQLEASTTATNVELHAELDMKKAEAQRAVDMLDELEL
jgi:hypothetical protein